MACLEMLFATTNQGKIRELSALLEPLDIRLLSLDDFNLVGDCPESGETFVENAMLKAQYYFDRANVPVFADDSGLEVDALNGAPGIHSARFGGLANHKQKCDYLLDLIKDVEGHYRTARFTCAAVFLDHNGFMSCLESVEGYIGPHAQGAGGFGYDPIFWLTPDGPSMAEIDMAHKNRISHRGKAFQALVQRVFSFTAVAQVRGKE